MSEWLAAVSATGRGDASGVASAAGTGGDDLLGIDGETEIPLAMDGIARGHCSRGVDGGKRALGESVAIAHVGAVDAVSSIARAGGIADIESIDSVAGIADALAVFNVCATDASSGRSGTGADQAPPAAVGDQSSGDSSSTRPVARGVADRRGLDAKMGRQGASADPVALDDGLPADARVLVAEAIGVHDLATDAADSCIIRALAGARSYEAAGLDTAPAHPFPRAVDHTFGQNTDIESDGSGAADVACIDPQATTAGDDAIVDDTGNDAAGSGDIHGARIDNRPS